MEEWKEREVLSLSILERKPPEDYFEGLKKIKNKRTKPIKQKNVIPLETESSSSFSADWKSVLTEGRPTERKCNVLEEKLEKRRVQLKMQACRAMSQHEEESSLLRQKLAEERYLQEQENLAESWLKVLRERQRSFFPPQRCTCLGVSGPLAERFPRKCIEMALFRPGGCDEDFVAAEELSTRREEVDDLGSELSSSLVFVDVEDSD